MPAQRKNPDGQGGRPRGSNGGLNPEPREEGSVRFETDGCPNVPDRYTLLRIPGYCPGTVTRNRVSRATGPAHANAHHAQSETAPEQLVLRSDKCVSHVMHLPSHWMYTRQHRLANQTIAN